MGLGYMKIPGIDGMATQQGHEKWIPIEQCSMSAHRNMPEGSNDPVADLRNSKVQVNGVMISKNADSSTPLLAQHVCAGTVWTDPVVIDFIRNSEGSGEQTYYTITLTNAFVKSHDQSGHSSSGGMASTMESLVLGFSKVKWEYKVINEKGKLDGTVPGSWDLCKSRTS